MSRYDLLKTGTDHGHGAPIQFMDVNPVPQPLKVRYDLLSESFSGDLVKADALYGIDKDRWMKARGYVAVIRWRLALCRNPKGLRVHST